MVKQFGFLLAFILVNFLTLQGQNWQIVRSGRIAFFNNDQGRIKCIRIDSVRFDKDSVLYPMANIQQLDYNCFTPKGNSWIGKKVIIQNNGVHLFFNNNNDTIRIDTRARMGESWTLFEIKDSIKITAEVRIAEIQSILGETDSVKTIGFKVYDKNGLVDHHYLSEKTLMISKKDGFVRMMNFNVFPKLPNSSSFEILEPYDLVGLTNPERGVQNLTWFRVHDYQVGDELHKVARTWDWSYTPGYSITHNTKLKYMEKKLYKDSVFYRVEKEESTLSKTGINGSTIYTYSHDTITEVYKPDTLFDKLPNEPIIIDHGVDAYDMINDGIFINKSKAGLELRQVGNDNCWNFFMWPRGGPGYYLKGLGGPYYENNEIIRGYEESLVYFKKGNLTWGTPLVITAVDDLEMEDEVKVYPNPASDFITIKNSSGKTEKYLVSLTDLQGKEVFKKETVVSAAYKLDISSLKDGAYLLKLQNEKKQVNKVIVKKN